MIDCPKCRLSNLEGQPNCSYCKEPLGAAPPKATLVIGGEPWTGATVAPAPEPRSAPVAVADAPEETREARKARARAQEQASAEEFARRRLQSERDRAAHQAAAVSPKGANGRFKRAAIASAIIPGLGQLAKGQGGKGYLFLFAFACCEALGFTGGAFVVWLIGVIDAYRVGVQLGPDRVQEFFGRLGG